MRSKHLIILIIIVLVFLSIQFIRPERNMEPFQNRNELFFHHKDAPQLVRISMLNACYNCHSNKTAYPWYASVAPASWLISSNITKAKSELNFSEWHLYGIDKQQKLLDEIAEVLDNKSMPPKPYLWMHRNANLNDPERELIVQWAKKYSETLGSN
jgi:hypothetical protein